MPESTPLHTSANRSGADARGEGTLRGIGGPAIDGSAVPLAGGTVSLAGGSMPSAAKTGGEKLLAAIRLIRPGSNVPISVEREHLVTILHAIFREPEGEPITILAQLLAEGARRHLGDSREYLRAARFCMSHHEHMVRHSKDFSRVCWALGELRIADTFFWHGVERYLRNHSDRVSAKRCATLAESAAKSGFSEPELFGILAHKIIRRPCALPPLSRRQSGRAFSSLDLSNQRLLRAIVGIPLPQIEKCSSAQRVRILHALSVLGVEHHPVLLRLARAAAGDILGAPMREISASATILSRLPLGSDSYFETLGSMLERRSKDLNGDDIAALSRAYLRSARGGLAPWSTLSARAQELLNGRKFSLRNLCDLLDGISHAQFIDPQFLEVAQERLAGGIEHLTFPALTHVAESFSRLREPASLFFEALPGEIERRAAYRPISIHRLARLLYPLGELRHEMGPLANRALLTGLSNDETTSPRDLIRMTYALLMENEAHAHRLFPRAVEVAVSSSAPLPHGALLQLYWVGRALGEHLPSPLEALAHQTIAEMSAQSIELNSFERKVGRILGSIGVVAKAQVPVHGYRIDFVVPHPEGDFGVECDGIRTHNVGRKPNGLMLGRYVVRDKVLTRDGFRMIHITNPAVEFEAELIAMLRRKFAA